jgi:iron complex transport system substrate-binding protein
MKHRWLIAAVGAVTVVAAGCGSDTTASTTPATAAVTATVATAAPASSAPAAAASKIVSLSPTATEMLYAIGAGDQVIAVDQFSDFPPEVLQKPHDLDGLDPNVEAIAKLQPDLVVMDADNGLGGQLRSVDIASWVGPAATTFDDVYTQLEQLGAATGHVAEAAKVVADMQSAIQAAVASAPAAAAGATYYHELDDTFYSVTSNTFLGQVYGLFGLKNIADGVQPGNDYPQLSSEFIVQADPDLIFLADSKCCKQDATTLAARPGWAALTAVKNGTVIPMDDDIASRWSPRIVDYIQAVAAAVAKVPAHSG